MTVEEQRRILLTIYPLGKSESPIIPDNV